MTRPAPWKRTTAAERRSYRAAYAQKKAEWQASPECAAYQAKNRHSDARTKARNKLKLAISGGRVRPFTPREIATLLAPEIEALKARATERKTGLTAEQFARVYLLHEGNLALLRDDQFATLINVDRPKGALQQTAPEAGDEQP